MAKVPRIVQQTRTTALPGPQQQDVTPQDFGSDIAAGVGKLGGAIANIAAKEKREADNTRLSEVDKNSTQSSVEFLRTYQSEFKLDKAGEFTDVAIAKYKASNDRMVMEIQDPEVKQRAQLIADQNLIMFENSILKYAGNEREKFKESTYRGALAADRVQALENRLSPDKLIIAQRKIEANIERRFGDTKTKEEKEALVNEQVGDTATAIISELIQEQRFDVANQYIGIGVLKEKMKPGAFNRLEEAIGNGLALEAADDWSIQALAEPIQSSDTTRETEIGLLTDAREKFKDNPNAASKAVDAIRLDFAQRRAIQDERVRTDYKQNFDKINNAGGRGAALRTAELADPANRTALKEYARKRYPLRPSEDRSQIDVPAMERKISLARRSIQQGLIKSNEDLAAKFPDLTNTDRTSLENFLRGVATQDRPNEIYKATETALKRMRKGAKPSNTLLDRTWRTVLDSIGQREITPDLVNGIVAVSLMSGDLRTNEKGFREDNVDGLDVLEDADAFRFFLPDITDKQLETIRERAKETGTELDPPGEQRPLDRERQFFREEILGLPALGTSFQDVQQIERANTERAFAANQRRLVNQAAVQKAAIHVNKVMNQETFTIENPRDPSNPEVIFGRDALILSLEENIQADTTPDWVIEALAAAPSGLKEGSTLADDFEDAIDLLPTFEQRTDKRRQMAEQLIKLATEQ